MVTNKLKKNRDLYLVLPHQLTDTFFVDLDIYILKMLRVCFYLKFKMSNWQNSARLLCEIVQILIIFFLSITIICKNLINSYLHLYSTFTENAKIAKNRITQKRKSASFREIKFANDCKKCYFCAKMYRNEIKNFHFLPKNCEGKP